MDITHKKKNLIEWLTNLKDERLVDQLLLIMKHGQAYPIGLSNEEIRDRLLAAEEDIKYGRVMSQEEVEAKFELRWSKK